MFFNTDPPAKSVLFFKTTLMISKALLKTVKTTRNRWTLWRGMPQRLIWKYHTFLKWKIQCVASSLHYYSQNYSHQEERHIWQMYIFQIKLKSFTDNLEKILILRKCMTGILHRNGLSANGGGKSVSLEKLNWCWQQTSLKYF